MNKQGMVSVAVVLLISHVGFAQVTEVPARRVPIQIISASTELEIFREIQMTESIFPEPIVVEARRLKSVTEKLEILSDSLQKGNVRGLAQVKQNGFQKRLLNAAADELMDWLSESEKDKDFQNLFKGAGPWVMIFLPKSPSSMDKAMDNLDMPNVGEGVLGAKRLPIDMSVKPNGDDLDIELRGGKDISLRFRMNSHDEIVLIS